MLLLVDGASSILRWLPARLYPWFGGLFSPAAGNSIQALASAALPWAADNGAFSGFDAERFTAMCDRLERTENHLFTVCPDVVGNWQETYRLFRIWEPLLHHAFGGDYPLAVVAQNGMERQPLADLPWSLMECVFIGGDDAFKLGGFVRDQLLPEVKRRGKWVHMGRVNTPRRIRYAHSIGCDSIDVSSHSRHSRTYVIPHLELLASLGPNPYHTRIRRQPQWQTTQRQTAG